MPNSQPAISLTMILRIDMPNEPGAFGTLANAVGDAGGAIFAVDMHSVAKGRIVRDVTIGVPSDAMAQDVRNAVEAIDGARIIFASDSTFLAHVGGKIRVDSKIAIKNRQDLSTVYTPGVARVSMAIAADPTKAFQLTVKRNIGGRRHRRHGGPRVGRHRSARRASGDGRQGDALQAVRRHRRLSDLPRHEGRRRDRRDGGAHRAGLRRNQPGRHQRSALLRGRGAADRGARHPGDARRSARDGGGDS